MKLKSFLLTSSLSLFLDSGLLAQDKYEYGVIRFDLSEGNDTLKIYVPQKIAKGQGEPGKRGSFALGTGSQKQLISEIERYQKLGWEVYGNIYKEDGKLNYQLRKKKN